jgi:outer membrane biosynthesis protein TonB
MANTFSFDDGEFADGPGADDAADEALASIEESPAAEEVESSEDPELMDVDLRLETADYYRAILKHEFFETESQAAQIVDREIRTFIRERLEVLLGLRAPRQSEQVIELPFEEDEIQALKLLASKVLKKPTLVNEAPAVKKMAAPAPAPRPEVKPAMKPKPQAKKVPAPVSKPKTAKPVAPKAKPAPAPLAKAQPQEPKAPKSVGAPSQSSKAKVVDKSFDGGETQTFINLKGEQVTLTEGEIIEESGRRYLVARNGEGTLYRRDITGQVTPPNRLPPMSEQQMSIMSAQFAEQQLAKLDETTGMAIVASLSGRSE